MKYIFVNTITIDNNGLSDQTQDIFKIYKIIQKLRKLSFIVNTRSLFPDIGSYLPLKNDYFFLTIPKTISLS